MLSVWKGKMQLQLRSGIEGRKTRKIWWPERQCSMDDAARGRATTRSSTSLHTHIPQSVAPVMLFLRCTRHIAQARPSLNLASTTSLLQSTLRPLAASQPAQSHVSHRVPPSTHPLTIHCSRTFSLLSPTQHHSRAANSASRLYHTHPSAGQRPQERHIRPLASREKAQKWLSRPYPLKKRSQLDQEKTFEEEIYPQSLISLNVPSQIHV
jgi:hypothetical protein